MSKATHFALVTTAFTTNVYAGNPAAVTCRRFLGSSSTIRCTWNIARNFNQPITSIVSSTSDTSDNLNDKPITRHIRRRFMVSNGKLEKSALCGPSHGTLSAAKVLFTQLGPGQENVDTIHFRCVSGGRLVAIT